MWLMAPASLSAWWPLPYHVAPGLIILVAFVMVLFLWVAALEYVDSTQSKAGQGSSEEAVEATGTESGTVAEGT